MIEIFSRKLNVSRSPVLFISRSSAICSFLFWCHCCSRKGANSHCSSTAVHSCSAAFLRLAAAAILHWISFVGCFYNLLQFYTWLLLQAAAILHRTEILHPTATLPISMLHAKIDSALFSLTRQPDYPHPMRLAVFKTMVFPLDPFMCVGYGSRANLLGHLQPLLPSTSPHMYFILYFIISPHKIPPIS